MGNNRMRTLLNKKENKTNITPKREKGKSYNSGLRIEHSTKIVLNQILNTYYKAQYDLDPEPFIEEYGRRPSQDYVIKKAIEQLVKSLGNKVDIPLDNLWDRE